MQMKPDEVRGAVVLVLAAVGLAVFAARIGPADRSLTTFFYIIGGVVVLGLNIYIQARIVTFIGNRIPNWVHWSVPALGWCFWFLFFLPLTSVLLVMAVYGRVEDIEFIFKSAGWW